MNKLTLCAALLSSMALFAADEVPAPKPANDANAPEAKPDNTRLNTRDRDAANPTADSQNQNKADVELASRIRREVVKDSTLSTYAHNVKIITQGGHVTLRGPVASEIEKQRIETIAKQIAGAEMVTDRLENATTGAKEGDPRNTNDAHDLKSTR